MHTRSTHPNGLAKRLDPGSRWTIWLSQISWLWNVRGNTGVWEGQWFDTCHRSQESHCSRLMWRMWKRWNFFIFSLLLQVFRYPCHVNCLENVYCAANNWFVQGSTGQRKDDQQQQLNIFEKNRELEIIKNGWLGNFKDCLISSKNSLSSA